MSAPNAELARAIATQAIGCAPSAIRRFTTGAQHYVFDVDFAERPSVVVRIGDPAARPLMAGAVYLSRLLRPLGAPLPEMLAQDIEAERPWLVLERLPGNDLAASIADLSDVQCGRIAAKVARAQAIVAGTRSAGRYGYAALPEAAPWLHWRDVLEASLARSRQRIASAGLFDLGMIDVAQNALNALGEAIDRIAPTPFLHDTTTKNVIVTNAGEFSGIVDVDDLCFGDPRYPAALTLAALMAQGWPIGYVAAWRRCAGWADDRLFRFYATLFLLDFMSEHGQTFNGNQPPSSPQARAVLCNAFQRSLAAA